MTSSSDEEMIPSRGTTTPKSRKCASAAVVWNAYLRLHADKDERARPLGHAMSCVERGFEEAAVLWLVHHHVAGAEAFRSISAPVEPSSNCNSTASHSNAGRRMDDELR